MACRLIGAKPLCEPMLLIVSYVVNWTLGNKLQWNFNRNSYIFIQENPFETVVWKMAAILSRPPCVNSMLPRDVIRKSWSPLITVTYMKRTRSFFHCARRWYKMYRQVYKEDPKFFFHCAHRCYKMYRHVYKEDPNFYFTVPTDDIRWS